MHSPHPLSSVSAVLALLLACSGARADTFAPASSYKQVTQNGKHVLVMIPPLEITLGGRGDLTEEGRAIREKYPQSGLYRNDGSTDPLWTVDWYDRGITVASDGIHMVLHGTPRRPEDVVIGFYANGRLLRDYQLGELVNDTAWLPRSGSGILMGAIEESLLDNSRLQFTLVTGDGTRHLFDLRTGERISDSRAAWLWWLGGILAAVVVIALCVWLVIFRPRSAE